MAPLAREDPDRNLGFALNLSTAVPEARPEEKALGLALALGGQW